MARTVPLPDEAATADLGRRLAAALLRAGPVGAAVLLHGDLGMGKTTMARALIRAVLAADGAQDEDVPSPTFTIVQTYTTPAREIWHVDLYRIEEPGELNELGLDEAFEEALVLVEWPDRLGARLPPDRVDVALAAEGAGRRATIAGHGRLEGIAEHV
ncbi:MAG: tRNA (adenosine(37)-N6)-threonylcarbamoyltransferase complex ATPase subunit type 1 TsaE [Alphaproteobacteria bacterium]|nr:tRNA (adenosine(37)-N6)-threonylcarbamoyltransferase complex ATPase subunit type 1 TsaE [Alphaproteobacteria bacterium]MDX5368698.1 tRNA (adenosine(37)-N6)-threonylcarbamoyltransferase complex ATPase subunit type 1 TsaE [Alphaproteobacteria bacterium]MDX5463440.1 tRNA (adenosine(37)-N6)-threonylcarbamoyltransferase complex ATPase subunit type 1 TsaE [Alphaproteobacteria bacterium]